MKNFAAKLCLCLLIGTGLYFAFFYERCEEPSDMQVAVTGLDCILQVMQQPNEQLRDEICAYLNRQPSCDLMSTRDKVLEYINLKTNLCTKAALEKEGFCTDKVDKK